MPDTVTGPRSHQNYPDSRSDNEFNRFFRDPQEKPRLPKTNILILHSRFKNFTLTLTAKKPIVVDGTLVDPENLTAKFQDNTLVLDLDNETDKKIADRLIAHPQYGLNRYFWQPAERENALAAEQVEATLERMRDPAFVDALQKRANSDDFTVMGLLEVLTAAKPSAPAKDERPETGPKKK